MEHQLATLYVILVEPSRSQSKIILQQFEELGIVQYKHVETGAAAQELIFDDVPDLVISSLHLEDMTGRDLVLKMRDQAATETTPFILISTATSFRELDPIKQAGASAVLPKPFSVKDLKRAVMNTMDWEHPDQIELEDLDPENLDVLVVDDSGMARKMISRTLNKMGIEKITEAADGADAIPLIQANLYDLIVTDFNMPEVDGHELLRYIRNESNQSSVPVLMVTTEGDASKLAAVQHDGVSAIVDKPFDVTEVKQLIESSMAFN
ncbi:MAG: response regulator [Gammaproteobacteria bacterium]|nr:response regulator [Gammaproteobacteria bacterium]